MAIATTAEQSSDAPQVILAIVRTDAGNVSDLEKKFRSREFVILQKRDLELNGEQIKEWFDESEGQAIESDSKCIGFVLQRKEAIQTWKDFVDENGRNTFGISSKADELLREYFPGAVSEAYLLQPNISMQFLEQLKPTLKEAINQICSDKPVDPIEHLANLLDQKASDSVA